MRRYLAIVHATVLEMVSEPLALLLTLGAAATVALSSAFHFHQFGEPTRMARDAGLSAVLVFGLLHAVFCTIRVFRREIESGTIQMALAHPVSRTGFFLSKVLGACAANVLFAATVSAVAFITVTGAEVGGRIAAVKGDLALMWGPALALDVAVALIPLVVAGAMNRFARWRFTATAVVTMFHAAILAVPLAVAMSRFYMNANFQGAGASGVLGPACRLVPALVSAILPAPAFAMAAAAFAVRFRDNAAASLSGGLFIFALPALSNYYLSDALARGGTVAWGHVALAFAATLPFVAAFGVAGAILFQDRDMA